MKITKQTLKLKLLPLSVILLSAFALSSCSKDDDDDKMQGTAHVMVVNSVEGSGDVNLYLDNNRFTTNAVAYGESTSYMDAGAGSRNAEFRAFGDVKTNFNLSLETGKYYSVFYSGSASTGSYVVTEDDRSAPPSGKAKVRFVHLSSAAASSVDFGLLGTTNKLVSNLAYKAASAYQTVDANTSFLLYAAGTTTVALTIPTEIQAGKIYTIYVTGSTQATVTYKIVAQN